LVRQESQTKLNDSFFDVRSGVEKFGGLPRIDPDQIFYNAFSNKTLYFFGPFVPIMIPWKLLIAGNCAKCGSVGKSLLINSLNPIILYMSFIAYDYSIYGYHFNNSSPGLSNIFVFAASGGGTVTTPLIFGEYANPLPLVKSKWKMIFLGNVHHFRQKIISFFRKNLSPKDFLARKSANWLELFQFSEIILSPRGYARNTGRFFESIHLGRIPFILHDFFPAIPYFNSSVQLTKFILTERMSLLHQSLNMIHQFDHVKFRSMRKIGLKYKTSHFSNAGVFDQIQRFLLTGYEDSDLICQKWIHAQSVIL
jgi:hypothetical protein